MTEERRAYLRSRRPFTPGIGRVYTGAGSSGTYRCIDSWCREAILQNLRSGWTFLAHGIGCYADGAIDWDYSTGGSFAKMPEKEEGEVWRES